MNANELSKSARTKALRLSGESVTVFASRTATGHRVFSVENNLLQLAKAQGALKNSERIEFPVEPFVG